ncbi:MAG: hypothetical protein R3D00_15970 [Bacteroidia bacterium]
MVYLLYFLASVIIFHKAILVYSVMYAHLKSKQSYLTGIVAITMIVLLVAAMIFKSWAVLLASFAGYILYNLIDASYLSIRYQRQPSPFMPVYALMFVDTVICYQQEEWIYFALSYGVYWVASLILGKKILNRGIQSQKI